MLRRADGGKEKGGGREAGRKGGREGAGRGGKGGREEKREGGKEGEGIQLTLVPLGWTQPRLRKRKGKELLISLL